MRKNKKNIEYYMSDEKTGRIESEREPEPDDILEGEMNKKKIQLQEIEPYTPRPKNWGLMLENDKRKEAEAARNFRKNAEKRKEILIEIIIDGTYSFSKVFLKVNYIIERIIKMIHEEKAEYRGIVIKYGLTVLHQKAEPCIFQDGGYFTESEEELFQRILDIEFYGGNASGRENLRDALDTGLSILNNYGVENAYRGLMMFSDSLPENGDMYPDFLQDNQDGYINKGLRFAVIYTYNDEYMPKLKMVDGDGRMVENGKNEMFFGSMEELLSFDGFKITGRIRQIVNDILNQTSVRI